jgi:nitrite reductase (NADH) small subunit/3-phenylpropionate/trans-cinnamate dioxygenase ferredoxin subunit
MRVPVGPVADVPDDRCVAVGEGRAVVVRVGGELRAFENRCLHQDSLLAGGSVRNGVLSCPLHFWRYRVADGSLIGSKRSLPRFPIDVVEGNAFVLIPDAEPAVPLREQLLARAREYDRNAAWQAEQGERGV